MYASSRWARRQPVEPACTVRSFQTINRSWTGGLSLPVSPATKCTTFLTLHRMSKIIWHPKTFAYREPPSTGRGIFRGAVSASRPASTDVIKTVACNCGLDLVDVAIDVPGRSSSAPTTAPKACASNDPSVQ
jgi:hypothetical protein